MKIEEQLSMLNFDIEKLTLELHSLTPFVQKIDILIKNDSLRLAILYNIRKTLKETDVVVSLPEYANIKKEINSIEIVVKAHRLELEKITKATIMQRQRIADLENKKNQLAKAEQRGTVLPFRGRNAKT